MSGVHPVAQVAKVAILTLAVFMALDQLGIARNIVTTAFTVILGAAALAAGLAFGLGNRELAGEYMRRWVDRAEKTRRDLARSPARPAARVSAAGTASRSIPIEDTPS
jgi:hypothetical protein